MQVISWHFIRVSIEKIRPIQDVGMIGIFFVIVRLLLQIIGQVLVILLAGTFEIHRVNGWNRVAGLLNGIVQSFDFAQIAGEQHYGSPATGKRHAGGAAESPGRPGNQYYLVVEVDI